MSTRCSFGYSGVPGKEFHLFEDYHDPGFVFLELPAECVEEHDRCNVVLRIPPDVWAAIVLCKYPNMVPADFWETTKFDVEGFFAELNAKRAARGEPPMEMPAQPPEVA